MKLNAMLGFTYCSNNSLSLLCYFLTVKVMSIFGMVYTGRKSQRLVLLFTLNKIFVRHSYLKVSQVVTSIISAAESSRRGALRGSWESRRQAVLASPGSPWRAAGTASWSCRPTVATGRCSAWDPPHCWSCCSI